MGHRKPLSAVEINGSIASYKGKFVIGEFLHPQEFVQWLELHGAIFAVASVRVKGEILRFWVLDGQVYIYAVGSSKRTTFRFCDGAHDLYLDFMHGRSYSLVPDKARELPDGEMVVPYAPMRSNVNPGRKRLLAARDGAECWYCSRSLNLDAKQFDSDFPSIEELLPRSKGGPTCSDNQVLACKECNESAGAMSVADKVRMRDEMRGHGSKPYVQPKHRKNEYAPLTRGFFSIVGPRCYVSPRMKKSLASNPPMGDKEIVDVKTQTPQDTEVKNGEDA